MKIISIILLMFTLVPSVSAELKGKSVVFIHGLQVDDINPFVQNDTFDGAVEQAGPVLGSIIDHYIIYDSARRLYQNSEILYSQVKQLEQSQVCQDGCYLVTGSTGDLVARYIISRLNQWEVDRTQFSILLSFDIVGAGGGTELADTAVSITQGGKLSRLITDAISKAFLGFKIRGNTILGIVNDLRPSVARNISDGHYDVPRLRIAAGGQTPIISKFLISGQDDGMVPLHSACGSARKESISSCGRKIKIDGQIANANGPKTLKFNNFPIMMASDMSHTQIDYKGKLIAVNNNISFSDSKGDSLEFSVKERHKTRGFWKFKKRFRTIAKEKDQLAIEFFINELN